MSRFPLLSEKITRYILFEQGNSPFGRADSYQKLEQLGEGSYATVFKGFSS
jgi:cyclin-dependent kinase 14